MTLLKNLKSGLYALLNKRHVEAELDEELDSYLDASTQHKQSSGLSTEAARRAAYREIGSRNAIKHQVWQSRWESTIDGILQDIRMSFRSLAKSPGYTIVALLSLALGIGANTAIFTLVHQVLLRNLPVQNPEQLVAFGRSDGGGIAGGIDIGDFGLYPWYFARRLQANPGPFQGIASYGSFSDKVNLRVAGADTNQPAILAPASLVSGNYFSVLGAQPWLGREIVPADDAIPGTGAVAVLSYHLWQQAFSSDPAVLGKTLLLNGSPFVVIGVMPKSFHGIKMELEPTEIWTPISMQTVVMKSPSLLEPQGGGYFLHIFGRLGSQAVANKPAPGRTQQWPPQQWLDQQIRSELRTLEGTTIKPDRQQEINRHTVPLILAANGVSTVRSQYGDSLQVLMAVVALVLLIACANLANFLLTRVATRQREIATRLALGSSRARIVRQSLIETMLLSLTGGLLGLAIALVATRTLIAFVSHGTPYTNMSPAPDLTVLSFTFGVSLLTGLLFGLAPAITAARSGAANSLTSNARTAQSSGGKSMRFWPKALVTAQIMLSLILLVGAGLFLRTLRNLQNLDYGFERTHLLLASFDAQLVGYTPSQTPGLHQQLLERLGALPGVQSVALAATPPISGGAWSSNISFNGYVPAPKENMNSALNRVSGQYFETLGIRMVSGRPITNADSASSLKVAVVNETLAHHFFPKGNAIGQSLTIGIDSVKGPWQIVGIAHDTKSNGARSPDPIKMTYVPIVQIEPFEQVGPAGPAAANVAPKENHPKENQDRFAHLILLRTTGDPTKTIADLRTAVAAIDPNLPLFYISTIDQQVSNMMSRDELSSSLTGIFSLLALLLAAIGLYGVMSYNVVRRTNEIGIRLALGAQMQTVLWMVLRESLLLLAVGLVLGLPLAYAATRLISDQLYALNPLDPATFAVAIVVVAGMTIFAAWLPARRAAHVDPMVALRCD